MKVLKGKSFLGDGVRLVRSCLAKGAINILFVTAGVIARPEGTYSGFKAANTVRDMTKNTKNSFK